MPSLSKREEKILALAESGGGDKELLILEEIDALEEKVDTFKTDITQQFDEKVKEIKESVPDLNKVLATIKGKDGATPEKGKDYFDGKDYVIKESDFVAIAEKVKVPIVEKEVKVIERTETIIREQPIVTEVHNTTEITKEADISPDEIRNKLELLQGEERLKASAIDGAPGIIVSSTPPPHPKLNDLWIQT